MFHFQEIIDLIRDQESELCKQNKKTIIPHMGIRTHPLSILDHPYSYPLSLSFPPTLSYFTIFAESTCMSLRVFSIVIYEFPLIIMHVPIIIITVDLEFITASVHYMCTVVTDVVTYRMCGCRG